MSPCVLMSSRSAAAMPTEPLCQSCGLTEAEGKHRGDRAGDTWHPFKHPTPCPLHGVVGPACGQTCAVVAASMAPNAADCGCRTAEGVGLLMCSDHVRASLSYDERVTRKHLRRLVSAVYEFGDDPASCAGVLAELVTYADQWLEKKQDVHFLSANTELLWETFCRMRIDGKMTEQQAFLRTMENFITHVLEST